MIAIYGTNQVRIAPLLPLLVTQLDEALEKATYQVEQRVQTLEASCEDEQSLLSFLLTRPSPPLDVQVSES